MCGKLRVTQNCSPVGEWQTRHCPRWSRAARTVRTTAAAGAAGTDAVGTVAAAGAVPVWMNGRSSAASGCG